MRMPYTTVPTVFYVNPSKTYSNVLPTTGLVKGLVNIITQQTFTGTDGYLAAHSATAVAGPYISAVRPGTNGGPGLVFTGAQLYETDFQAGIFSATEAPVTLSVIAQCTSPSTGTQALASFASSTGATPTLTLQYNSGNIVFTETNTSGTFSATAAIDSNLHCITAIRTGTALVLRVDGVQVATAAATAAAEVYSTFCLGAQNSNGTVSKYFTGTMGQMVIQDGVSDFNRMETYLMTSAGLVLGTIYS